jgi:hypothetical protein
MMTYNTEKRKEGNFVLQSLHCADVGNVADISQAACTSTTLAILPTTIWCNDPGK